MEIFNHFRQQQALAQAAQAQAEGMNRQAVMERHPPQEQFIQRSMMRSLPRAITKQSNFG